jgi:hypothetical protein
VFIKRAIVLIVLTAFGNIIFQPCGHAQRDSLRSPAAAKSKVADMLVTAHNEQSCEDYLEQVSFEGERPVEFFLNKEASEALTQDVIDCMVISFTPESRLPGRASGNRSWVVDFKKIFTLANRTCSSVKLKGVVFDSNKELADYSISPEHPGRTVSLYDVKEDGSISLFPSNDRPTGALLLQNARNEFEMTRLAFERGLPVNLPIGYGMFKGISFQGNEVGFVILGIQDPYDIRLDKIFLKALIDGYARDGDYQRAVYLIKKTGRVLRQFHDAGFIHNTPVLHNFSIYENIITIHDLDWVDTVNGMTTEQIISYRLLDLMMAVHYVSRFIDKVNNSRFINAPKDIINAFLKGYFYKEYSVAGVVPSWGDVYIMSSQIETSPDGKPNLEQTMLTLYVREAVKGHFPSRNEVDIAIAPTASLFRFGSSIRPDAVEGAIISSA